MNGDWGLFSWLVNSLCIIIRRREAADFCSEGGIGLNGIEREGFERDYECRPRRRAFWIQNELIIDGPKNGTREVQKYACKMGSLPETGMEENGISHRA